MPPEGISCYSLDHVSRNRITLSSPAGTLSRRSKSFLALLLHREQFWCQSSMPLLACSIRLSIIPGWPQIERIWSHLRQTHSHRQLRDHHQQGLLERREFRAHASAADSRSSRQACCRPSPRLSTSWKLGRDHRRQQAILANCARRAQCDVQRPCTLCLRAGATCSATVRPTVWKNQGPGQRRKSSRPTRESPVELPAAKRPRRAPSVENTCMASPAAPTTSPPSGPITPGDQIPSSPPEIGSSSWVSSSGAMQFMEEVNCTSVLSF